MKRWKWNYLIDAGLFICMMAIAGIGLLMKYILLPGREVNLIYGNQTDLVFLGMDRHQWGSIHFIISLVLLGLLLLHIILHWSMIVTFFRRFVQGQRARYIVGYGFALASLILIGFPLFVRPELVPRAPLRESEGRGRGETHGQVTRSAPGDSLSEEHSRELDIRGFMTLREIAERYGVPESHLLEELGITDRGAARERLGQLRGRYNFTMSDVEEVIQEYRRAHPPPPGN